MTILIIGLVCVIGGWLVGRDARPSRLARGVTAGLIAAVVLTAFAGAADEAARYRLTLLGLRYQIADGDGLPLGDSILIGGGDEADLPVGGAEGAAGLLLPAGDSAALAVVAARAPDARAVVMVEDEDWLGRSRYDVLGSVPLEPGDTIRIAAPGAARTLVVGATRDSTRLGPVTLPMPWLRLHTLSLVDNGGGNGNGGGAEAVVLPRFRHGWPARARHARPGIRQRSYPLADVLQRFDSAAPPAALASFLFYDRDGRLSLAALDPEVVPPRPPADSLPVWRPDDSRRLLVAALPLRDYPEPDLELPERYGVRPLRSFRLTQSDGWLTVNPSSPEILSLDRAALDELRLQQGPGAGADEYRIRLVAGSQTASRAVAFGLPGQRFATAAQAVFRLADPPRGGHMEILTPSGLAEWTTGEPFTLGSGDRALLLRVDAHAFSAGFWLASLLVLGLAVTAVVAPALSGTVFTLALATLGLAAIRLLMAVGAHLEFPFIQEAQQTALWVLPFMPWAVAVAGQAGERWVGERSAPVHRDRLLHAALAAALVLLALALFPDSIAKRLVLVGLAAGVGVVAIAPMARLRGLARRVRGGVGRVGARARALRQQFPPTEREPRPPRSFSGHPLDHLRRRFSPRSYPGIWAGAALLLLRLVLLALGGREQITLGGTRLGVSVLYTPLTLLALAWALRVHTARPVRAAEATAPGRLSRRWRLTIDLGLFLALAFVLPSFLVSDYGIVFTTAFAPLVLLALLGLTWSRGTPWGRWFAPAAALPLLLFLTIQFAPGLLHPSADETAPEAARMEEWSRNQLLLLERGDPEALKLIGQRRSEALAVARETMRSYTRGNWFGQGMLHGRVSNEIRATATREHAVSALLAAQWGAAGVAGLVLVLLTFLLPVPSPDRRTPAREAVSLVVVAGVVLVALGALLPWWYNRAAVGLAATAVLLVGTGTLHRARAADRPDADRVDTDRVDTDAPALEPIPTSRLVAWLFLFTFTLAGLYMVLANYGWFFFTGKNVFLLGLDSLSDLLESLILLGVGTAALAASVGRAASPAAITGPDPRDRIGSPGPRPAVGAPSPTNGEGGPGW